MQQACLDENVNQDQLVLHSDNGSPMKGATMLAMLEKLGVAPSFSRESVSDDNAFSEALFRTVKYRPTFPITTKFETIFDARSWTVKFVEWYNNLHMHSGLKFVTPVQRHLRDNVEIMRNRHRVYQIAKENHPERWCWSRDTRNWELPTTVTLNANRKNRANSAAQKEIAKLAA